MMTVFIVDYFFVTKESNKVKIKLNLTSEF